MSESEFAIEDLNMLFHPTDLLKSEQKDIGTACRTFQVAHSDLHSSTLAEVYSAPAPKGPGRVWWHSNDNDKIEHVTVRYNRRKGGDRCHVYRDGSGKLNPHKPSKKVASRPESGQEEEVYDSDCTVELLEGEEPSED